MKVEYGEILQQKRGILVHDASCRDILCGRTSLAIKQSFPVVHDNYSKRCKAESNPQALLGEIISTKITNELFVVLALIQINHGKQNPWLQNNYKAVEDCFFKINILAKYFNLPVFFTMLGSDFGNKDWLQIKEIILMTLDKSVEKTLYIYQEPPYEKNCLYCD